MSRRLVSYFTLCSSTLWNCPAVVDDRLGVEECGKEGHSAGDDFT